MVTSSSSPRTTWSSCTRARSRLRTSLARVAAALTATWCSSIPRRARRPTTTRRPSSRPTGLRRSTPRRRQQWIDFLLEENQQQAFMQEGFRPGTAIPYARPAGSRFWPDPSKPTTTLNPDRIEPAAARTIVTSWGTVEEAGRRDARRRHLGLDGGREARPGSGRHAAHDRQRRQCQPDRVRHLLGWHQRARTGAHPSPKIGSRLSTPPNGCARSGNTALYTAIEEAIRMTDEAPADPDATRGVVVLTDGRATSGLPLHSLIHVMSRDEARCRPAGASTATMTCISANGTRISQA